MSKLFQQICDELGESDYDFEVAESDEVLRLGVETDAGEWVAYLRVMPDGRCVIYSQAPFEVPDGTRKDMAELITRLNFGIVVGNLEMDFADGECRFKSSFDSGGEPVPPRLLHNFVDGNLANMDRYLPSLQGLVDGSLTVDDAVRAAER